MHVGHPTREHAGRPHRAPHVVFRREGDCWTLAREGCVCRLKTLRGLAHIAELVRRPHREVDALQLVAAAGGTAGVPLEAEAIAEAGLRVCVGAGADPLLDCAARAAYRARLGEAEAEEAAATAAGDPARAAAARREIDALTAQLGGAGPRGGSRWAPATRERARLSVRNAIATALETIRRHDEALWRHLAASIKTGTFCCYAPDEPVVWEL